MKDSIIKSKRLLAIAVSLLFIAMSGCSSSGTKKEITTSSDYGKMATIDSILALKTIGFKDYKILFSGESPLVLAAIENRKSNQDTTAKIKVLCLIKLYHKAEALANSIPDSREANENAKKIVSWPVFTSGTAAYKKWHEAIKAYY